MKKSILILFAIIIASSLKAKAHDFIALNNGDSIYYNLLYFDSTYSAEVTYRWYSSECKSNEYSGDISIPDSVLYNGVYLKVISISHAAFSYNPSLSSITIPKTIFAIGYTAFQNCSGLTDIIVNEENLRFSSMDGVLYSKNADTIFAYPGGKTVGFIIPNTVTTIGKCAFSYCPNLSSITIPNTVTSIGEQAFGYCGGLSSITIPNSVIRIGRLPFIYCKDLLTIDVSEDNLYYSSDDGILFNKNKDSLIAFPTGKAGDLIIPNSVNHICEYAFINCINLTSVIITNSVTSIGENAFYGCSGLSSIEIPSSITSISEACFSGCEGLTSVIIPNSIDSIGRSAFSVCTSLSSIIIPSSVTFIGDYAFYICTGLTSFTCKAVNPPEINYNTFNRVNDSIPVFVPCASINAYNDDTLWNDFINIQCDVSLESVSHNIISTKLYPNPTNGKAKLEVEGLNSNADMFIYDIFGRLIQKHEIKQGNNLIDIDLSGFGKGVYSINILNSNINHNNKLILQ
ncbi:MAG: leucine-rich repeat protein [Bacteroidales bacterium]|nr:leucine-rich repeat protein [Bacteroidales bacterium]